MCQLLCLLQKGVAPEMRLLVRTNDSNLAKFSYYALSPVYDVAADVDGSFGKSVQGNAKLPLRTATSEPRLSLTSSGGHGRRDRVGDADKSR